MIALYFIIAFYFLAYRSKYLAYPLTALGVYSYILLLMVIVPTPIYYFWGFTEFSGYLARIPGTSDLLTYRYIFPYLICFALYIIATEFLYLFCFRGKVFNINSIEKQKNQKNNRLQSIPKRKVSRLRYWSLFFSIVGILSLVVLYLAVGDISIMAQARKSIGNYAFPRAGVLLYISFLSSSSGLYAALTAASSYSRRRITYIISFIPMLIAILLEIPMGGRGKIILPILTYILASNFLLGPFKLRLIHVFYLLLFSSMLIWFELIRGSFHLGLSIDDLIYYSSSLEVDLKELVFRFVGGFSRFISVSVVLDRHYYPEMLNDIQMFLVALGPLAKYLNVDIDFSLGSELYRYLYNVDYLVFQKFPSNLSASYIGELISTFSIFPGVLIGSFLYSSVLFSVESLCLKSWKFHFSLMLYPLIAFQIMLGGTYSLFKLLLSTLLPLVILFLSRFRINFRF